MAQADLIIFLFFQLNGSGGMEVRRQPAHPDASSAVDLINFFPLPELAEVVQGWRCR